VLQGSLLDWGEPAGPGPLEDGLERTEIGRGAWIDLRRGWLSGSAELFEQLLMCVPWQAERRPMYERIVDVPRLVKFYDIGAPLPAEPLAAMRSTLASHYGSLPGGPVCSASLSLYRDGRDSVAWHGDRVGRGAKADTVVAIVSLGAPRRLLLRPRGGGPALRYDLGCGDLFVMGGSCQRSFEHAVPKTLRPVGPRISVQYRQRGVR
jgi:alkylated DNA repair dioxygenase AlkB